MTKINYTPLKLDSFFTNGSMAKESEPMRLTVTNSLDQKEQVSFQEKTPKTEVAKLNEAKESETEKGVANVANSSINKSDTPSKLHKAGLRLVDPSNLDPKHIVNSDLPDINIYNGLKKPVHTSLRWMSEMASLSFLRAHIVLKKVHGHIVRVIKK